MDGVKGQPSLLLGGGLASHTLETPIPILLAHSQPEMMIPRSVGHELDLTMGWKTNLLVIDLHPDRL